MATIRARKEAFLSLMGDGGKGRQRRLAKTMKLAESTISRQLNGGEPSAEFMASVLDLWPEKVTELFDIVGNTDEEPAAA